MQRILNIALAVLLAIPVVAAGLADSRERAPEGRRPHSRSSVDRGDEAVPAGIPPLFRELCPHKSRSIERQMERHPESARRILLRLHRNVKDLNELKMRDPREFSRRKETLRLEDEVARLSDELRNAGTEKEGAVTEKKLRAALSELFDRKEEALRARITRMEEDISKAKARLDRRRKMREKIIDRRLEELRENDDLRF